MQKRANDSEKVGWETGRGNARRQGRETREARMEQRLSSVRERISKRCGSQPKKQRSSGIGSAERGEKRARVSDVETIRDNKLVMASSSVGRARHHGRKAEEDIGQNGKQGEASKKHKR